MSLYPGCALCQEFKSGEDKESSKAIFGQACIVIPYYFGSVQISVVFENSISAEILFR